MSEEVKPAEGKKPWLSKTIWVNLLMALAPLVPQVGDYVALNPEAVPMLFGVVNILLRAITKDKLQVK